MYGLLFTYICCILMMNVDIPYVDPMDNSDLPRGDPWISDPSTPRRSVILQSSKGLNHLFVYVLMKLRCKFLKDMGESASLNNQTISL